MITGHVNARWDVIIPLRLVGPLGSAIVLAVLDTGFDAALTLPVTLVGTLGLIWDTQGTALLANGAEEQFGVYLVDVDWDGSPRPVRALAVGDEALIGVAMLVGYELRVEFATGGTVEIQRLKPRFAGSARRNDGVRGKYPQHIRRRRCPRTISTMTQVR